ncbi:MAG: prephenate dehydratase [Chloroflexi bacterium]|nr:prephenate dehydratase [Chloroflexota bacterium]
MERIDDYRREIDEVDRQIVAHLSQRARLSIAIGRLKTVTDLQVYHPEREATVLANVEAANAGPLPNQALRSIYTEILSASRVLQRPVRVAYLGPIGTFSHEAAQRRFGSSADFVPCNTIADIFQETQKCTVDYGVVPVENSTGGAVANTLDLFLDSDLQICAEIGLSVSHQLLSHGELDEIVRVYSHPQAFAQCRRWLNDNLSRAQRIEVASTALAVQMATSPDSAAIGSSAAATAYGVPVRVSRIEDLANNVTRFFVIGPRRSQRSGRDKTSIVFSIRDRTGALHDALSAFARHQVNLTRIESRPSRRRLWDYVFFVEMLGHPEDEPVAQSLEELAGECLFVRVLGAWPLDA